MFRDWHIAGGHNQGYRGGHVERVVTVAPGAAHIDGIGRCGDRDHPVAHCLDRGGDLNGGFPPIAHDDQEMGDVFVRRAAVEHGCESLRGGNRI